MASKRASRMTQQKTEEAAEIIELSSDSEPEAPEVEDEPANIPEAAPTSPDVNDQPLLRAAGIRYRTDRPEPAEGDEPTEDISRSTPSAKLAVRAKDTGSARHRHVSIEIPIPTSSELRRIGAVPAGAHADGQEGNEEDVFKTPMEKRQHITFDDSEHDEFVTPREGPSGNPLDSSIARPAKTKVETKQDEDDEEEESDDDAPPEAVSTRAAEAQTLRAAEAAARAAERQAAALKRKRQERDAFFKQQAEERKRAQRPAVPGDESDDASPSDQQDAGLEHPERRKKEVVKLLPLELLESDDEDDGGQGPNSGVEGRQKRRRLGAVEQSLLREPRLPRDQRVGSTVFRVVAGNGNPKLAPKVRKQALSLKEMLLRRDRIAKPRGGFYVKKR